MFRRETLSNSFGLTFEEKSLKFGIFSRKIIKNGQKNASFSQKMPKFCIFLLIFSLFSQSAFCQNSSPNDDENGPDSYRRPFLGIGYLKYFEDAYPDVTFDRTYDGSVDDWKLIISVPDKPGDRGGKGRTGVLYWANGAFLPKEELENSKMYWSLLYSYPKILEDPASFTEEEKKQIQNFSSTENRKNGAGTPMFLFDLIYDSQTRLSLETHIKSISLFGHRANVHERIIAPLARVEKRVNNLAASNEEVKNFLAGLKSNDAYFWRLIAGTKRKSFHSLGIAVDILPKSQGGKQIFWSWAADKYPKTWMLIPLKDRWMPPQSVIEIFESEGFIWGGKWIIYDNMHFEYHPELIKYNFEKK